MTIIYSIAAFFVGVLLTWLTICRPWQCSGSTRGHRWETVRALALDPGPGSGWEEYRQCRACGARRLHHDTFDPYSPRIYIDHDWLEGLRQGLPRWGAEVIADRVKEAADDN